jgi:hypothetical protein
MTDPLLRYYVCKLLGKDRVLKRLPGIPIEEIYHVMIKEIRYRFTKM